MNTPAQGVADEHDQHTADLLQAIEAVAAIVPDIASAGESQQQNNGGNSGAAGLRDGRLVERFGRFQILRRLGSGGNGFVFLVFDSALERKVALKLPCLDTLLDARSKRRFMREAKAAAALHHPSINPVFDVGHVGAVCYIVSAFCHGPNLQTWLEQHPTPNYRMAATWCKELAKATHYAHSQGLVHRDIKPSNILMQTGEVAATAEHRGLEEHQPVPLLADFGAAKWLGDDDPETKSGEIVGTLAYMSPEQANGVTEDIGPPTDIYALGAVLYELLTGRPPVTGVNNAEKLRQINECEPVPPRRICESIPADLEAICLKCLERQSESRYESAELLEQDLDRFLRDEPTKARPIGWLSQSVRWGRRRPWQVSTIVTAISALLVVSMGGWWSSSRLQTALQATQIANDQAKALNQDFRRQVYAGDVRRAQTALALGNRDHARKLLAAYEPRADEEDVRGFGWYHLWSLCQQESRTLETGHGETYYVGITPGSGTVVTAGEDGTVRFWDADDGTLRRTLRGHSSCVNSVDMTADGARMVTGSCDRSIRIWDLNSGEAIASWDTQGTKIGSVVFTPDEGHVVSGDFEDPWLRLWDIATGEMVSQFVVPNSQENCGTVGFLDGFRSETGEYVLSSARDGLRVHDLSNIANVVHRGLALEPAWWLKTAAVSPDKKYVALASSPQNPRAGVGLEIQLLPLDSDDASLVRTLAGHSTPTFALKYSPDGRLLASGTDAGLVGLWDVATGDRVARFVGHRDRVTSLQFSEDGRQLLSASADGTIKFWPVDRPDATSLPVSVDVTKTTPRLCFTADGTRLVLGGSNRPQIWNTGDWTTDKVPQYPAWGKGYSAHSSPGPSHLGGGDIVYEGTSAVVQMVPYRAGVLTAFKRAADDYVVHFSPDGVGLGRGEIRYKGVAEVVRLVPFRAGVLTAFKHAANDYAVHFSPDGADLGGGEVAYQGNLEVLQILPYRGGLLTAFKRGASDYVVLFAADGVKLGEGEVVYHGPSEVIQMVAYRDGVLTAFKQHGVPGCVVRFSHDGSDLGGGEAVYQEDPTVVQMIPYEGGVLTVFEHAAQHYSVHFSPDGTDLRGHAPVHNGSFVVRNCNSVIMEVLPYRDRLLTAFASSDQGNALACNASPFDSSSCSVAVLQGGKLSVLDAVSGESLGTVMTSPGNRMAMSRDGRWLATTHYETIGLWDLARLEGRPILRPGFAVPSPPVALSTNGSKLAATDAEGTRIILWDFSLATNTEPTTLSAHTLAIDRLAFSPDSRYLGSASRDGTVRVWGIESGLEQATFINHLAPLRAIAFGPRGRVVATGSDNGDVRIWDPRTGIESLELHAADGSPVLDVAFSPDGTWLACLCKQLNDQARVVIWHAPTN